MASLEERAAQPREYETETIEVVVGGELTTLKFTELPGHEWHDIASRAPVRVGVDVDKEFGYNPHVASSLAAPRCGVVVEGDVERTLDSETWGALIAGLSGSDFATLSGIIFYLNELSPQRRLTSLKKASAATAASEQK